LLLDHGADVNATMEDTRTALSFSVEQRTHEITRMLLAGGADANAKIRGTPLLTLSVAAENAPAIELLVKAALRLTTRCQRANPAGIGCHRRTLRWSICC